jgi:protein involved in polysaccharide export with SLBB domain
MIGANVSVTMGELRSIRVFVLGDAERPGSYTVSGLSTITHALYASGGIKPIGSLRNIQLKRDGQLITTLDLYDLLLRGDTRNDLRLMPGDVIFIPPVNIQVGVDGEVRRPGIYELMGAASAEDLVALAGGMTPSAYPQGASLSRVSDDQARIVQDVNLRSGEGRALRLRGGDLLNVPAVLQRVDNSVELDRPRLPARQGAAPAGDAHQRPDSVARSAQATGRRELRPDPARVVAGPPHRRGVGRSRAGAAGARFRGRHRVEAARQGDGVQPGADVAAGGDRAGFDCTRGCGSHATQGRAAARSPGAAAGW